jgi:hypothetical protein
MLRNQYRTHVVLTLALFSFLGHCFLAQSASAQTEKQKWLDSTEKSTIEAEFVRLDGASVILKKDGKDIAVPLAKLSLSSHLQALKLAQPDAYAKPVPKVVLGLPSTPESEKLLQSPFPADATVEQFMDALIAQLESKNTMVLWHALTPEMQADVEDLIVSAVDAGGSGVLVQIRALTKQIATLMNEKEQFFLSSPQASNPQFRQQLVTFPALTRALSEKENWDAENFKPGNVASWLSGLNAKLGPAGFAFLIERPLVSTFPGLSLRDTKKALAYKVLSQSDSAAEIQFVNPVFNGLARDPQTGQMRPSKEPRKIALVRVSEKWLPKALVDTWKTDVEQMKLDIETNMPLARTGLAAFVIPLVTSLSSARSQQEFNVALQQVTQRFAPRPGGMGMGMGMGMGSDMSSYGMPDSSDSSSSSMVTSQ